VVIVNPGATVRARFTVFDTFGALESVTLNESGDAVTAAFGVPVIAPVAVFNASPSNDPPVKAHVYGAIPPLAASVLL